HRCTVVVECQGGNRVGKAPCQGVDAEKQLLLGCQQSSQQGLVGILVLVGRRESKEYAIQAARIAAAIFLHFYEGSICMDTAYVLQRQGLYIRYAKQRR